MYWDWNFAWGTIPDLLRGLWITVQLTLGGSVLALAAGLVLAILRRTGFAPLRWLIGGVIEVLRGTPFLVQLFFVFYVLPKYGIQLPVLATGIIVLGLNYSAYTAECYRAGIEGVPQGQWEAGRALNLSTSRIWRAVILPQAIPKVIPALGNYVNQMFKDSAIVGAIGLFELLNTAKQIGGLTYRFLEPLTMAALLFLAISYLASIGVRRLERRMHAVGSTTGADANPPHLALGKAG